MTKKWIALLASAAAGLLFSAAALAADPRLAGALEAPDGDVLRSRLVVMSPRMSKGLEFDVVVLVDPAVVGRTSPGDLYVAMTRPTRRLRMVSRTAAPGTARPARSTSAAAGV